MPRQGSLITFVLVAGLFHAGLPPAHVHTAHGSEHGHATTVVHRHLGGHNDHDSTSASVADHEADSIELGVVLASPERFPQVIAPATLSSPATSFLPPIFVAARLTDCSVITGPGPPLGGSGLRAPPTSLPIFL